MAQTYHVVHPASAVRTAVTLQGSKSESNRALILNSLSGGKAKLVNLSAADDTTLLKKILGRGGKTADVKDCGTCLRFLIPYYAVLNKNKVVTGSARLCERPVGKLVEALLHLGFKLNYLRNEGFPPVEVIPVEKLLPKDEVTIDGGESSQYISALAMVAPLFDNGLRIGIRGKIASRPYIDMTLDMMKRFGIGYSWEKEQLAIEPQKFVPPAEVVIEGDWSSAAPWYAVAALSENAQIDLYGLSPDSLQGDRILTEWMQPFGVDTELHDGFLRLTKADREPPHELSFDFSQHPDLAPSVIVLAAAMNVSLQVTGTASLHIKESDRLEGLAAELRKVNAWLEPEGEGHWLKSNYRPAREPVDTHDDHRMVMAFAPLGLKGGVTVSQPASVSKSYPGFWDDLKEAGFEF